MNPPISSFPDEIDEYMQLSDERHRASQGYGLLETYSDTSHPQQKWPILIPFGSGADLPILPYELLPGFAGQFSQELAIETETPTGLAVALTLAACALAASRRFRVEVKPKYFEPLNLWILVALPPGNRKSAVQAATAKPLTEWQSERAAAMSVDITRLTSEAKSIQALVTQKRTEMVKEKDRDRQMDLIDEITKLEASMPEIPRPPLLWTSDATPERLGTPLGDNEERMAWLSSEGGVFDILAGRYSGGIPNLDLLLKAHSGDAERVERGTRPPIDLQHPLLTIGISPQPSVLEGLAAKPGFRGRGLLGRFLYLLPESPLGYRSLDTLPMSESTRTAYDRGIRDMLDTYPADEENFRIMYTLRLSREARAEWLAFAHHIERQFRPGGSLELVTDWGGKAPGAAARIAGVLHCIQYAGRTDVLEISLDTMQSALEIMAVFMRHSIHAMGVMGNDKQIAAAQLVLQWLLRNHHRQITQRDMFNALRGRFPKMDQLTPALEILAERGYIRIQEQERHGAGRPPSPLIIVRPDLWEDHP
jgi:hypothetical protein